LTHAHLGWYVRERIPYLILPVKQSLSEPSLQTGPPGQPPGPSRIEPSAKAQISRSDMSKPLGKPPGPSRIETIYTSRLARRQECIEPSTEAPRASRRARRRTRLDPNHPPKRYTSEPSGKPPGPSRSMRHRASRRAYHAVHRAIRQASRCRRAACDPALKPQPVGTADIEPNPLDYSL